MTVEFAGDGVKLDSVNESSWKTVQGGMAAPWAEWRNRAVRTNLSTRTA